MAAPPRHYDVRDQLGHWVAPRDMRNHPCPHACCRGKRVHPSQLPVSLDRAYLRSLSPAELGAELAQYVNYADTHGRGLDQITAEIERRGNEHDTAIARSYSARVEAEAEAAATSAKLRLNSIERRKAREQEWRDEVYRQWLQAEAATRGVMLNKAGKKRDIDERTLFTGPEARVRRYASPELIEYFESHPRPTRAAFLGSIRERRTHLAGRRIG